MNTGYIQNGEYRVTGSLIEALGLRPADRIIAFVGGGGKTTLIYRLAEEYRSQSRTVVITTTTHIGADDTLPLITDNSAEAKIALEKNGLVLAGELIGKKLKAVSPSRFDDLCRLADIVLVEADGAKMLPLKYPAPHEPVIPANTEVVVRVAGLDAVGQPIGKICHRPERVGAFLHKALDERIAPADIARLYQAAAGEKMPPAARSVAVLNQTNSQRDLEVALTVADTYEKHTESRLAITGYSPDERPLSRIYDSIKKGQSLMLAIEIAPICGKRQIVDESFCQRDLLPDKLDKLPRLTANGDRAYFIESFTATPKLIIAGGGHVGTALAKIADLLELDTTVIDDRPAIAAADRFPAKTEVICGDFASVLAQNFGDNAYFVIATHGHENDQAALEAVLKHNYRYIGVMGSRKKAAFLRQELQKKGFGEAELSQIHSPVGLKIGAVTPAEIAVSIMGEIIQIMRETDSGDNNREIFELLAAPPEPLVLATIIEKIGSGPRGSGSRMLVRPDGSILGTIGGGQVEYLAIQKSLKLLKTGGQSCVEEYDLGGSCPDSVGICGGRTKVLLECVYP